MNCFSNKLFEIIILKINHVHTKAWRAQSAERQLQDNVLVQGRILAPKGQEARVE
jgi:hypothetical protein